MNLDMLFRGLIVDILNFISHIKKQFAKIVDFSDSTFSIKKLVVPTNMEIRKLLVKFLVLLIFHGSSIKTI